MVKRDLTPKSEQFYLIEEVMKLTRRSRPTIYRWGKAGIFPKPYRIGGSIAWKRSEYDAWARELQN